MKLTRPPFSAWFQPLVLAVSGNTITMAEAGPVPHDPAGGKVVAFAPDASNVVEVASGALLLVDVAFGRGRTLFALSPGDFPAGGSPGAPALADTGSLVRANKEFQMPLYMDIHKGVPGLTAEAVAEAHRKDLEVQEKHGVKYLHYWFSEEDGAVFCLSEAPNKEAAEAVHREAHGLVADEIVEVKEGH